MIPGGSAENSRRVTARAAPGYIWRKGRMFGAFVCASSTLGVETMVERQISASDALSNDIGQRNKFDRPCSDARLSPAERLEIIALVAAVGISECSAWIIPVLERDGLNEDSRLERTKC